MLLRFTKMHGLGNDLMVLDLISQHAYIQPQQMRAWSDRRYGVGFRRLALIEVPQQPDSDFSCRIFDENGAEVDWLASDVCCVARLVADRRLISKVQMRIELRHAVIDVQVHADGAVTVPLVQPEMMADCIAVPAGFIQQAQTSWMLDARFNMLSNNGLHAILPVTEICPGQMVELVRYVEQQSVLPRGTTVSAVQVNDRNNLTVLAYELGGGEIDSFHPNLVAVVCLAIKQNWVNRHIHIELANSQTRARVQCSEHDQSMHFTGSAIRIYEGQIRL